MLNIHLVMQELAKPRPLFHSEADFQFALAWQIHEMIPDTEVRLEFKPFSSERMRLDIWLPTLGVAIELKYPTYQAHIEHRDEEFTLKDGARDIDSYDYIKDIQRLERIVSDSEAAKRVFAVVLTNDPNFWQQPRRETIADDFRLHEDRQLSGKMAWSNRAGKGSTQDRDTPLSLHGSYHLHWSDYSDLPSKYGRFRYLAVEVWREDETSPVAVERSAQVASTIGRGGGVTAGIRPGMTQGSETTTGWTPLPDWDPDSSKLPVTLRFPDGSERKVGQWNHLLQEIAAWLWSTKQLTNENLPVPSGPKNYIVSNTPFHSKGRKFDDPKEVEGTPLVVETNTGNRKEIKRVAEKLLNHCAAEPRSILVKN